jgi:alkylhydroperoxidase family enzyme
MAWIRTVTEDKATGTTRDVYEASQQLYGFIPNIRQSMSLNAAALDAYVQLSSMVYHGSILPPDEREMVATTVSALNRCHY